MRVSRLYVQEPLAPGQSLVLPETASHYLATVLRLPAGAAVLLFNGRDGEFAATLVDVNKKRVCVEVGELQRPLIATPLSIHLGVGLSRGDRMDFVIQKCTELGVDRITPLYSEFGEVRFKQDKRLENRLRHWQQVAISACEQCGRLSVPRIDEPVALLQWLAGSPSCSKLVLDPDGSSRLADLPPGNAVCLLSGPEGGFSESEIQASHQAGFQSVQLGPRILRTETAPLAALAILQACFGDL